MSQQIRNYLFPFIEPDGINNQQGVGTGFIIAALKASVIEVTSDPLARFPCRQETGLK